MAHLLRGKQAGIQNDLSVGLTSELFAIDDLARYGVNSQICCMAFDPVQGLLAVGTKTSSFGSGQIYVFGKGRVQIVLPLPPRGSNIKTIQFCAEKIVALDWKNDVMVFSIELKQLLSSHSPPGTATVLCTDPMLDYALLGMQNGEVFAYDMDRESLAPFKIPNLWTEFDPRARLASIVSLQLHPRDVGTLLIAYPQGALIYSFKLNKATRHFVYEVPPGAPGGDGMAAGTVRRPKLTQALWHPTGTFIMTGYDDSSIVFWDTIKDGRMLMARTLADTNIATPGAGTSNIQSGKIAVKEPLFKISWCANHPDPEDTAILIAGGQSAESPMKGLTLYEMGRTPVYSTSSWDVLKNYLESPKRQRVLPTPPGAEVVDFCLIPKVSPHFAGAHDPVAIIALLASGELLTLSFPSGFPINASNQLPISLTFVHPFVKSINSAQVDRERWLGLQERRQHGPSVVNGGSEIPSYTRKRESRGVVQTVHADGTIRIWDPGYGDEIENEKVIHVDVAQAVGRYDNIDITATSFAGASAELAVGLRSGELAIFRWSINRNAGREPPSRSVQPGELVNITDRAASALNEGLCPAVMLDQQDGPTTAVCMSEVGFAAAAFEGGSVVVVDLRGPAIVFNTNVQDFSKQHHKMGSLRRRGGSHGGKPEWGTQLQFSIMTLEGEDYSSICLHVGTNLGHLATFKVLPDPSGRFTVQYAGSVSLDSSRIMYIAPINTDDGTSAAASQSAMGGLRSGLKVNGALVAVSPTGINVFRPATAKGAHKGFDSTFCDCARVVRYGNAGGHVILALFGDGTARAYALPSLKEIKSLNLTALPGGASVNPARFHAATITAAGSILAFTGPSEIAVLTIWGTGEALTRRQDRLFHADRLIPPRPTISTVAWVTGTQYITPLDMDLLIGGPNRPPSKRMIAQARAEEQQRAKAGKSATAASLTGQQDEGYWAYMQRQLQERTERLGMMGDNMDSLEESSANWLEDVNKFVGRQKRNAATGIIKARFGL